MTERNWGLYTEMDKLSVDEWNEFLRLKIYDTKAELDADAAGWGTAEAPRFAWCKDKNRLYCWNGATLIEYPVSGGAGAPTDADYLVISSQDGLSAEVLHNSIVANDLLHIPKLHKTSHQNAGTDEIDVTGLSGVLGDEQDAGKIKGKTVDSADIGDGKILSYDLANDKLKYIAVPGGGDMTTGTYDPNTDGVVKDSDKLEGNTLAQVRNHDPKDHQSSHRDGGSDQLSLPLACVARTTVGLGGVDKSARREINLIPDTGKLDITVTDNAANERADVQFTLTGGMSFELAPDYTVYWVAGASKFYAMDVDGDTQSNADLGTLLNTLIAALPSTGGVIYLQGGSSNMSTGVPGTEVVINKTNVSIISDRRLYSNSCYPHICKLKLDATSADVRGVILEGLHLQQLHLYSNGHAVREVTVRNCEINQNNTYHGVIFEGDGSDSGWVNEVTFVDCKFDLASTGNTWGIVTLSTVKRVTEVRFIRPNFTNFTSTTAYFFVLKDGAQCHSMYFDAPRIYTQTSCTSTMFYNHSNTSGYTCGWNVYWYGGRFELHAGCTLIEIPASTNGLQLWFHMSGCSYSTGAGTLTLFNITNANWDNYMNGLSLIGNRFPDSISIGTFPNSGTGHFKNDFQSNRNMVTDNCGVSSVTTGTAVNHGLVVATGDDSLVYVQLTADGADAGDVWVTSRTTTQFTINFDGGGTKSIAWRAKYEP